MVDASLKYDKDENKLMGGQTDRQTDRQTDNLYLTTIEIKAK